MHRSRVEAAAAFRLRPHRRTAHLLLRAVLGLTLAATATGKALDVAGFRAVLAAYDLFPVWLLWPLAVAMPVLEALVAATMLTGWWVHWGAVASVMLHSSFAVVLTVELLRGVDLENCGCFGVFLARPLRWSSPLEDVALVTISLAVLLTWAGSGVAHGVDHEHGRHLPAPRTPADRGLGAAPSEAVDT